MSRCRALARGKPAGEVHRLGMVGLAADVGPFETISAAAGRGPPCSSTSRQRHARPFGVGHRPRAHGTPGTFCDRNERPLPAHSSVASSVRCGIARARPTSAPAAGPRSRSTASRQMATSSCGTSKWLRTKNSRVGVTQPCTSPSGVSLFSGDCVTILSLFGHEESSIVSSASGGCASPGNGTPPGGLRLPLASEGCQTPIVSCADRPQQRHGVKKSSPRDLLVKQVDQVTALRSCPAIDHPRSAGA